MKKQIEDSIKSLITDGTINQSQGDKILETLSNSGLGMRRNSNNSPNGNQQNRQHNNQNNNANNSQNKSGNGKKFNPLSKLVDDGVITQEQDDAVMQKIRGNFGGTKAN